MDKTELLPDDKGPAYDLQLCMLLGVVDSKMKSSHFDR